MKQHGYRIDQKESRERERERARERLRDRAESSKQEIGRHG